MGGEKFMYPRITERNLIDGTNFTLRDTIFPIPQTVIDANRILDMRQVLMKSNKELFNQIKIRRL